MRRVRTHGQADLRPKELLISSVCSVGFDSVLSVVSSIPVYGELSDAQIERIAGVPWSHGAGVHVLRSS